MTSKSSLLGGAQAPTHPSGTDIDALGPSDSSDSGSDVQTDRGRSATPDDASGALPIAHDSSSDASGTGERASADGDDVEAGSDISPDRIGELAADEDDDEDEEEDDASAR
ncbi:MAG: hypothetical protein EOO26_14415 [Comamonadaceae bacterium]|nr:MAG: hypothetical protein EOO26_14415 [Comamonadaceae bacterium]